MDISILNYTDPYTKFSNFFWLAPTQKLILSFYNPNSYPKLNLNTSMLELGWGLGLSSRLV